MNNTLFYVDAAQITEKIGKKTRVIDKHFIVSSINVQPITWSIKLLSWVSLDGRKIIYLNLELASKRKIALFKTWID